MELAEKFGGLRAERMEAPFPLGIQRCSPHHDGVIAEMPGWHGSAGA